MTYLRLWLKINMARHLTLGIQLFSDALCSLIVSEPAYVEYNCVCTRKKLDDNKTKEATGDLIGKYTESCRHGKYLISTYVIYNFLVILGNNCCSTTTINTL
jgi:hypothetical protein